MVLLRTIGGAFRNKRNYKLVQDRVEYAPIMADPDALCAWKSHALGRGDLPIEYLTPRVICEPSQEEFAFIGRDPVMPATAMQGEIVRLAPWTYHLEVNGATTRGHGTYNEGTIRFHRYRANLIAATVARLLGNEIKTSTVVDLGCNCGFFTLEMAARGAQHALGLDFREENVTQANFLKSAFGLGNAEFRIQNVKDLAHKGQRFDVCLNLGLMYHLSTPYEVMRSCFDVTNRFCVVDTNTHTEPFSGYHVMLKDTSIPIEGDLSFELQPTYRGILDTIKVAGFNHVVEIVAPVKKVGVNGLELFASGLRRCLIAFNEDPEPYLRRLTSS